MKKSFLVLICVVFIAAIVAVGLFGLKYKSVYDDLVYPESIDCDKYRVNSGLTQSFRNDDEDYDYYEFFTLDRNAKDNCTVIELLPTVTPAEAKADCTYTLSNAEQYGGIDVDSETGVITIDHAVVINQYGNIRGLKSFVIIVTSNQDAALKQKILIIMK